VAKKGAFTKAAAGRLALEIRAEIGLSGHSPLDPALLAAEYRVPIYPISGFSDTELCAAAIAHFGEEGMAQFSAALLPMNPGCCIIENDFHSDARRRANLAHEMAHVLQEHEFTAGALLGPDGCRSMNKTVETEADWLAGELLIPSKAAARLALRGATNEDVAEIYGVSVPYARMRMNLSGAHKRAQRARDRRSSSGMQ
jgi:hypothetical protein